VIYAMPPALEMHAVESKAGAEKEREEQEQRDERECDYYGPYYNQPHQERDTSQEASRHIP
jgi:hypothetical protein